MKLADDLPAAAAAAAAAAAVLGDGEQVRDWSNAATSTHATSCYITAQVQRDCQHTEPVRRKMRRKKNDKQTASGEENLLWVASMTGVSREENSL